MSHFFDKVNKRILIVLIKQMNLIDFFRDYWINYWQSVVDTLTDITSPAYVWFFLFIMIKVYRKFFL